MAYQHGKTYWFISHRGVGRALSVYGNSQVSQNRNVIVWDKQDVNDQKWLITLYNGFARIRSSLNLTYALNIWTASSNFNNCDIHTWADNPDDSKIDLMTVSASENLYKLRMVNKPNDSQNNLFMTATSSANGGDVRWQVANGTDNQIWKLIDVDGGGSSGGGTTSGILSKDTAPPTTTASAPFVIKNIPDKNALGGLDKTPEYHPGCGFTNGTDFSTSSDGSAVISALQKFAQKVFKPSPAKNFTAQELCYYLYGERYANGSGQQFHPGVDISYGLGKPIRALFGGTITHVDKAIGAVCIQVPTQDNVNMNYLHMQDIVKTTGNVVAGEIIGYQGYAGLSNSNATHLHFEVRQNGSPYPKLGPTSPSVAMNTIKPYGYMQG